MFTLTWTEARLSLLRELTAQGLSASQIAARLHVTRNAVIGKWHRLGDVVAPKRNLSPWNKRTYRIAFRRWVGGFTPEQIAQEVNLPLDQVKRRITALKNDQHRRRKQRPKSRVDSLLEVMAKAPSKIVCESVGTPKTAVDFLDHDGSMCHYPFGDKPFKFCSEKKYAAFPYCAEHARLCYQLPRNRLTESPARV